MKALSSLRRNTLAVTALVTGAAALVWLFSPGLLASLAAYCLSGRVFTDTQIITGGALDQPSLHKGLFLFCVSFAIAIPAISIARWLTDGRRRYGRVIFRALSTPLFLLPFALMTVTFAHLLRYIAAMGFTSRRAAGLAVMLVGYAILGLVLRLTWSFPPDQQQATNL